MDLARYFDNAATTPVDPRVRQVMLPYLGEACGNAHSLHTFGAAAREAAESAREHVARLIGAEDPSEIVFTSGATESNNWVLRSFSNAAIGPMEHSSIKEPAEALGHEVLPWKHGAVQPPTGRKDLISLMTINNETGQLLGPEELTAHAGTLHTDLTQALGKIPLDLSPSRIGLASFSAHKLYGPKGIGGLYIRGGTPIQPLLLGGDQEDDRRAGTLNVPAIVGFGEACRIAAELQPGDFRHAQNLRNVILDEFEGLSDWQVNGGPNLSPFILSLSFRGVEGETLVLELDREGFAISAGAACSSRSVEPSHVLLALGLEPEWLRGTVRISFGRSNTVQAASQLAQVLRRAVGTIREMKV